MTVIINGSTDYVELQYFGAAKTTANLGDGNNVFSGFLARAA